MKLKHLLALPCALFASTLYAEQKPTDILLHLAQPQSAQKVTAEQRLAIFPTLADIPSDVCSVTTIADFRKAAEGLMTQPYLAPFIAMSGKSPDEILKQIPDVTSASFAISPALDDLLLTYANLSYLNSNKMLSEAWSSVAADPAAIKAIAKALDAQLSKGVNIDIPTLYLSVSFAKDSTYVKQIEDMMMMSIDQVFSSATPEDLAQTGLSKQQIMGGVAVGLNMSFLFDNVLGQIDSLPEESRNILEPIMKQLKDKKVYIAFSRQGNHLRMALTGDITKPIFPVAAAQSIASSPRLDFSNDELRMNPLLITSTSADPKTVDASLSIFQQWLAAYGSVFTAMGAKDATIKASMDAGAKALDAYAKDYIQLSKQITCTSLDAVVSADGNLNIEITTEAGYTLKPGKLKALPLVDNKDTLLYGEVAGGTTIDWGMGVDSCIDNGFAFAEAITLSLNPDMRKEIMPTLQVAKAFAPDAKQLLGNLCSSVSGMSAPLGMVVDVKGQAPNFLNGDAQLIAVPRASFYTTVTDRSKIAQGWEDAKNTAKTLMTKIGQDPAMVDLIATTETQKEGMTLHTPSMPVFTADAVPNIVISDQLWTLGNSPAYNMETQKALTGSVPFTGSVFALKIAPLMALANEMGKAAKPETGDAEDMRNFAQAMALVNMALKAVYATSTVENGKHVCRIRFQMQGGN